MDDSEPGPAARLRRGTRRAPVACAVVPMCADEAGERTCYRPCGGRVGQRWWSDDRTASSPTQGERLIDCRGASPRSGTPSGPAAQFLCGRTCARAAARGSGLSDIGVEDVVIIRGQPLLERLAEAVPQQLTVVLLGAAALGTHHSQVQLSLHGLVRSNRWGRRAWPVPQPAAAGLSFFFLITHSANYHIFVAHDRRACERAAGKLSAYHFAARDWNLTMPAAVDTMSHFTSVFRSSRFIERSFKKSKSFMLPKAASCLRAGTATMYSEESCEPSVRLAWNNK